MSRKIVGVSANDSDLIWLGSLTLDKEIDYFSRFVKSYSFKREVRTLKGVLENECQYDVFHLTEFNYHSIFNSFSITEDSDLNDIYNELESKEINPNYFIAFKLNGSEK
ncbi:hypothetical protein ABVL22_004257 [Salmonella enterica]